MLTFELGFKTMLALELHRSGHRCLSRNQKSAVRSQQRIHNILKSTGHQEVASHHLNLARQQQASQCHNAIPVERPAKALLRQHCPAQRTRTSLRPRTASGFRCTPMAWQETRRASSRPASATAASCTSDAPSCRQLGMRKKLGKLPLDSPILRCTATRSSSERCRAGRLSDHRMALRSLLALAHRH